ncbi:hypothetical protein [Nocardia sp. NPDC051981]|uniref:hypothetical protein n=1 Tax=Nocardia sp. NPDC051981 TaxID=3155417 RepID=UPI00344958B6
MAISATASGASGSSFVDVAVRQAALVEPAQQRLRRVPAGELLRHIHFRLCVLRACGGLADLGEESLEGDVAGGGGCVGGDGGPAGEHPHRAGRGAGGGQDQQRLRTHGDGLLGEGDLGLAQGRDLVPGQPFGSQQQDDRVAAAGQRVGPARDRQPRDERVRVRTQARQALRASGIERTAHRFGGTRNRQSLGLVGGVEGADAAALGGRGGRFSAR